MKVAIITPYYKETEDVLLRCHESVRQQTIACDHFMVADGFPQQVVKGWPLRHFELASSHNDNGNTPRVIGALSAFNLGYDAVAFLDADNWYHPEHIERMVSLQRKTGAIVCTSNRTMHRPDGSYMFDDDKNNGKDHIDTSCLFMTRPIMPVLARWAMMPRQLGPICDTVYWGSIRSNGFRRAHDTAASVRFTTVYEADFERLGETPPPGVKSLDETSRPFMWVRLLSFHERERIRREVGWLPESVHRRLARQLRAIAMSIWDRGGAGTKARDRGVSGAGKLGS